MHSARVYVDIYCGERGGAHVAKLPFSPIILYYCLHWLNLDFYHNNKRATQKSFCFFAVVEHHHNSASQVETLK